MSSDFWSTWVLDQELECGSGAPCHVAGGATFWLRRAGGRNSRWNAAVASIGRLAEEWGVETAESDPELRRRIYAAFFTACVAGWSGVTDRDGNELAFDCDVFVDLCERAPELFTELANFAAERGNYAEREVADAGEAVGNGSNGSANGGHISSASAPPGGEDAMSPSWNANQSAHVWG